MLRLIIAVPDEHYKDLYDAHSQQEKLFITSLGIGTHSGDNEVDTDIEMFNGIVDSGMITYY
jgi:hypothetical protein